MNRLVWKLLRRHISVPQLAGFAFANLFGMFIVLLGYQFYRDVAPVFTAEDSFMRADYVVLDKRVGLGNTLAGSSNAFTTSDIEDLGRQAFATKVGAFTSNEYKVDARMSIGGTHVLNSEIYFESIPDEFVEAPKDEWHWKEGAGVVPIILPRSYIAMYNFGFARSHSLPRISDGLMGMIDVDIFIQGSGGHGTFKGKVIGFTSRMSSILVPQAFMDWSNAKFAPGSHADPTRLVLLADNPASEQVNKYLDRKGYEVEDDKMQQEKTVYFLRLMVTMVMAVGLVISALSFYILMLSIYLLVQKNSSKLETLLLIGYSPGQVARPYQLLTIGLNLLVLAIALVAVMLARNYYMGLVEALFPDAGEGSLLPATAFGACLFLLVSLCNMVAIRRKITSIWKRKE